MKILSKFCHNKHLTRLYDNSVLSRYFTVTMHINALLFNSATFIKKQVVIHKNIIINSKANKYQQNYKADNFPIEVYQLSENVKL